MGKWWWSYLVWGLWALAFLLLEIPGNWRWGPWVTLSETVEHLEVISTLVKIGCFALLLMLVAHWVFHGGFLKASVFGLVVALAAHYVNHRWP